MEKRVSIENKSLAKYISGIFEGLPRVREQIDADDKSRIDVLSARDSPRSGVTSYSTLGLSDYKIDFDNVLDDLRAELLGICCSEFDAFENMIGTSAFCVINSQWPLSPGAVFPDVVSMYKPELHMKHFLFVPPGMWDRNPETQRFDSKVVAWLLAVPISESERLYVQDHGSESLERIFVSEATDIADIYRSAVV